MNKLRFPLSDKLVSLSISESPNLGIKGFSELHVRDFLIEFSRHLLASGAQLSYGGDFRKAGYTEVLMDLIRSYQLPNGPQKERLRSYLAWPIHLNLTVDDLANYRKTVEFVRMEAPEGVEDPKSFLPPVDAPSVAIWARSLRAMRQQFASEVFAGIVLGGQVDGVHEVTDAEGNKKYSGFKGFYPGIAEEATELIRAGKPVYLIGAFGGAAEAVIQALEGQEPEVLTWDYQKKFGLHAAMIEYHNAHLPEGEERVGYGKMVTFLKSVGVKGLRNGLSEEENKRLFVAKDLSEVLALIFSGMARLLKG